jgi:hypothetical protein
MFSLSRQMDGINDLRAYGAAFLHRNGLHSFTNHKHVLADALVMVLDERDLYY